MLDFDCLPQIAAEYDSIDIEGFLREILAWQREPETNDTVYATLDTVIDLFLYYLCQNME